MKYSANYVKASRARKTLSAQPSGPHQKKLLSERLTSESTNKSKKMQRREQLI